MIHQISIFNQTGGGVLPYKRLIGMCRWMGSHFHDSIDYNGVAFSIDLLEWGGTFRIFGVSRDSKWEDSQVMKNNFLILKIRKLFFIEFNNKLALTALHSAA